MFTHYNLKLYFTLSLFFVSFILLGKVILLPYFPDFVNYYYGAQHILQNQNPYLYDVRYFTPQSYPPIMLLFFIPITIFPIAVAAKVWTVISVISLVISLNLLYKIHKAPFFSPQALFLSSLVFLAFPVKFSLGMGQVNIVILLLISLFVYFLAKKKHGYAGVAVGFSLMIKFFPLLLIPYFVITKNWKILGAVTLTIIILVWLSILLVPLPTIRDYFQMILPNLLSSWKGEYYNQSLTGFLMRIIQDPAMREPPRLIISGILFVISFFALIKSKQVSTAVINLKISLLITLSVLINSFSWQHHFVWLLIPFMVTFFYIRQQKLGLGWLFILGLSYLLVAGNLRKNNKAKINHCIPIT